jgi:tetratricopeptide (TPR) repeat protein
MKNTFKIIILLICNLSFSQSNFEKGEKLFNDKKYTEAKPFLEADLKASPNHKETIEMLGDIAGFFKKWNDAITYYGKLKTNYPKNANFWYKYGGAMGMKAKDSNKFKAMGMIDDIENAFLTSAKLDPKHTDVRWALIILYLELPAIIGGSEKKAQKYADELMGFSKIDGIMAKGHIDEYFKRYESAEKYYLQGVNLTHSKTAYKRLIDLYKKTKETAKMKQAQVDSDKFNK